MALTATLIGLDDAPDVRIDRPILLVGRNPDCDVVVDSRKVSRKHCCIAQVNDYLVVRDLGSTNGIQVNGRRLEESKVVHGDELIIGNIRYRVVLDTGGADVSRRDAVRQTTEEYESYPVENQPAKRGPPAPSDSQLESADESPRPQPPARPDSDLDWWEDSSYQNPPPEGYPVNDVPPARTRENDDWNLLPEDADPSSSAANDDSDIRPHHRR